MQQGCGVFYIILKKGDLEGIILIGPRFRVGPQKHEQRSLAGVRALFVTLFLRLVLIAHEPSLGFSGFRDLRVRFLGK